LAVNEAYAEANGYIMRHLDPENSTFEPKDARWNKVKILEKAIHPDRGWTRDLDYVAWVVSDLIFLDMSTATPTATRSHATYYYYKIRFTIYYFKILTSRIVNQIA